MVERKIKNTIIKQACVEERAARLSRPPRDLSGWDLRVEEKNVTKIPQFYAAICVAGMSPPDLSRGGGKAGRNTEIGSRKFLVTKPGGVAKTTGTEESYMFYLWKFAPRRCWHRSQPCGNNCTHTSKTEPRKRNTTQTMPTLKKAKT